MINANKLNAYLSSLMLSFTQSRNKHLSASHLLSSLPCSVVTFLVLRHVGGDVGVYLQVRVRKVRQRQRLILVYTVRLLLNRNVSEAMGLLSILFGVRGSVSNRSGRCGRLFYAIRINDGLILL